MRTPRRRQERDLTKVVAMEKEGAEFEDVRELVAAPRQDGLCHRIR